MLRSSWHTELLVVLAAFAVLFSVGGYAAAAGGTYFHPDSGLANSLNANGSINGSLVEGESYARQNITFLDESSGRRFLKFDGRFDLGDVDLDSMAIEATSSKIAVNTSGTTGMSENHSLFLPNKNTGLGVRVCPNAKILSEVYDGCSEELEFNSVPDTINGVSVDLLGAWDLDKAEYVGSIGSEDKYPYGISVKSDGTKVYEGGTDNDRFYEYECSNAWDLSSCSYNGVSINSKSSLLGIFFKPDGDKLYEVGVNPDSMHEYSCSDAWNLSSCSYRESIGAKGSVPSGMFLKSDGTRLYQVARNSGEIYEYSCSDAWDLGSCSYTGDSISTQDDRPEGLFFKSDGTTLYELGSGYGDNRLYEYSCSDAWNLSSCSYTGLSIGLAGGPTGIFFRSDGAKLYESDVSSNLHEYSLGGDGYRISGRDIGGAELLNFPQYFHPDTGLANSLTANGSINGSLVEGESYNRQDITFVNRSSGRRFLEFDGRFDLEDVDLDELTIEATDNKVAVNTSGTTGMSDNHTLFVPNNNNGSGVRVCPGASTAGDVGSGCPDSINFSGPFPETKDGITADLANSGKELSLVNRFGITDDVRGVEIKPDGTKMFLPVRKGGDEILAYNLSTPWDVSTAKFSQSMSATQIRDVQFKPDGTEMFRSWTGVYSDKIIEYHLSTPWDISTASSVNSEKFGIENERGFTISEDGKVLYTGYNDQIVEFEMSTPWDTSTMSQTETKDLSEDIPGSDGWNGITILDKGKELQVISDGFNEDAVLLTYKLSEAFNLSTAKLVQRINMTQFNDSERFTGLVFGKDKSWMYSYESKHQFVGQYGVVTRSGEYRLDGFTKDGGGGLLGPVGEEEEPVTGDTTAPLVECSECHAKDVVDVGEDQVFTPVVNDSSNFTVYICGDRECSSQDLLCINSSGSKCTSSAGPDWDSSQNYWVRAIDSAGNSRKVYGGRFIVRKELLDIGRKKKVNISLEGEDTRVLYVHNSDGVPHSYVLETEVSEGDGRLFTSLSSGGESGEDFIRFEVDSKSTRSIVSTFRAASCYRRCVKDVTFVLRNLETGETDSVTVPVEIERKETGVSAPGIGLFHFVFIAFLSLVYLFYRKVPAARDSS